MALHKTRRAELLAANLPSEDQLRERTHLFLARSGLAQFDLADMLGYNRSTLCRFLSGQYKYNAAVLGEDNSLQLRERLTQLMDRHEVNFQVDLAHRHYQTSAYREIHAAALSALQKGTAYIIDGPPGTEKTESLRRIEAEINASGHGRAVYVYARNAHAPGAFLIECCREAGIPARGQIDNLLRKLRFFLAKGRVLLMVDEAQHLGHDGLEVLRQLLDLPPYFGVMLGGSHDLTQRLSSWQMEQWRSRVRKTFSLTGPTDQEAYAILRAELGALSDAECAQTVAACQATAQRLELVRGKPTAKTFTYTSARDLFGAIARVHDIAGDEADTTPH